MTVRRRLVPRALVAAVAALGLLVASAPAMTGGHAGGHKSGGLEWGPCTNADATAAGWECATYKAPLDYDDPSAGFTEIAVTRLPAKDQEHRIGGLFINYGGPGGDAVATTQTIGVDLFGVVNDHFDLVAFDPRGVGESSPAIDCKASGETEGIYAAPFTTPENLDVDAVLAKDRAYTKKCLQLNKEILPHASTANVARDMDAIRAAMGDEKLNYFGFSYGTFLGATYSSLFPDNYRAMVLDGPVDAKAYINNPQANLREQSAGFERGLGRFFQACAQDKVTCPFVGADPWAAYDALVAQANMLAIPADGFTDDPRPVNGDALLNGTLITLYNKGNWPLLAQGLTEASQGDATIMRFLADIAWGNNFDGTWDPLIDRYFTIGAIEQKYPRDIATFLEAGDNSWGMFEHFWWNSGYVEINYALWPIHDTDAFYGPFTASKSAPKVLEIATTYDPATPFRGAKRLATQLGNVRFLTMVGDGHTAYLNGSPTCVDTAVVAQIETLTLPPAGTICQQDVPFVQPPAAATATTSALRAAHSSVAQLMLRFRNLR
jgi:pimeloyl-ACP methyl ester carboxylesterase